MLYPQPQNSVKDMKKVEGLHHNCLRKLLGITYRDKVSNIRVRELTNQPKINEIICKRRLTWYGHVIRMPDERPPKIAMNWKPPGGKRRPGRPKLTWIRTVKKDIGFEGSGTTMEELSDIAADRESWRSWVALCAAAHGKD